MSWPGWYDDVGQQTNHFPFSRERMRKTIPPLALLSFSSPKPSELRAASGFRIGGNGKRGWPRTMIRHQTFFSFHGLFPICMCPRLGNMPLCTTCSSLTDKSSRLEKERETTSAPSQLGPLQGPPEQVPRRRQRLMNEVFISVIYLHSSSVDLVAVVQTPSGLRTTDRFKADAARPSSGRRRMKKPRRRELLYFVPLLLAFPLIVSTFCFFFTSSTRNSADGISKNVSGHGVLIWSVRWVF